MEEKIEVELVAVAGPRAVDGDAAVKVTASEWDAEEPVVGKERWEEIWRLRADGMRVAQIARVTGLDRKTVRRCLRQAVWCRGSA